MNYCTEFDSIKQKLDEALAEKNLVCNFDSSHFPITLSVLQDQSPEAQMTIYEESDGNTSSRDSAIRFIFLLDGIVIRTDNRVVVSDAFMSKIKGLAKKLHAAFCYAYFAQHIAVEIQQPNGAESPVDENAQDFSEFFDDADDDE